MPGWKRSALNMSLTTRDWEALRPVMNEAFGAGIPIAVGVDNCHGSRDDAVPCKFTESSVCVVSSDIDYKHPKFSADWV